MDYDAYLCTCTIMNIYFNAGDYDGILLGDSGYPLSRYLMTPYLTPRTQSEERFNSSLCRTRVLIEQTFGIMKRKFQALHFGLRTSPDQTVSYITACCILHNIGIERGDTIISGDCRELNVADCQQAVINAHPRADGVAKRFSITQAFFFEILATQSDIIVDLKWSFTACI